MNDKVTQFMEYFLKRLGEKDKIGTNISEEHYRITEGQIIEDLRFLLDEVYDSAAKENDYSLIIQLSSGQKFRISVEEILETV